MRVDGRAQAPTRKFHRLDAYLLSTQHVVRLRTRFLGQRWTYWFLFHSAVSLSLQQPGDFAARVLGSHGRSAAPAPDPRAPTQWPRLASVSSPILDSSPLHQQRQGRAIAAGSGGAVAAAARACGPCRTPTTPSQPPAPPAPPGTHLHEHQPAAEAEAMPRPPTVPLPPSLGPPACRLPDPHGTTPASAAAADSPHSQLLNHHCPQARRPYLAVTSDLFHRCVREHEPGRPGYLPGKLRRCHCSAPVY